ncbi:hypothetical protein BpHYR1_029017 [Brachionus plicatilis]|uniref:Uncharacterized protein n=1 Tax=Brachionus plicatilis TaxID=10195 RepID=A0A3M7SW99_BRAPC|nr:hypothetical protein BpHYR1_029017 [Brachionus plicatilis]
MNKKHYNKLKKFSFTIFKSISNLLFHFVSIKRFEKNLIFFSFNELRKSFLERILCGVNMFIVIKTTKKLIKRNILNSVEKT